MHKKIKRFFTSDMDFTDTVSYRRAFMINSILVFLSIVFFSFMVINFTLFENYLMAFLDLIHGLFSLTIIIYLRMKKNIKIAALLTTYVLGIFLLFFTFNNQNTHFGLVWSLFFPIVAIFFNGHKQGFVYAIVFNFMLYALAYNGIDTWNYGLWNYQDMIRLVIASILLTYGTYMIEESNEEADKELKGKVQHEKEILATLQRQAITDDLTQMYNRRYFNTIAPSLLNAAHRDNNYITFFILDIDYFKKYNDYYGHQAGDLALQMVAKKLKHFMQRENDFIFRIGGEEFAGIFQSQNKDEAHRWLASLNEEIRSLDIEHLDSELPNKIVTISCGVFTTKVIKFTSVELVYKIADDALYKAKDSGRDRTEFLHCC